MRNKVITLFLLFISLSVIAFGKIKVSNHCGYTMWVAIKILEDETLGRWTTMGWYEIKPNTIVEI